MKLQIGDRVRVIHAENPYTGCRGAVVPGAQDHLAAGPDEEPLGYYVAIDGENGRARPFLAGDLELLRPATVNARTALRAAGVGAQAGPARNVRGRA